MSRDSTKNASSAISRLKMSDKHRPRKRDKYWKKTLYSCIVFTCFPLCCREMKCRAAGFFATNENIRMWNVSHPWLSSAAQMDFSKGISVVWSVITLIRIRLEVNLKVILFYVKYNLSDNNKITGNYGDPICYDCGIRWSFQWLVIGFDWYSF